MLKYINSLCLHHNEFSLFSHLDEKLLILN
nr:MAG TPA: hypothetical protein [Caudoviricetes sp.]